MNVLTRLDHRLRRRRSFTRLNKVGKTNENYSLNNIMIRVRNLLSLFHLQLCNYC